MIGGYADGNDGNDGNLLRHDPVLQRLVGKTIPGTADVTLASQPTMSRLDNGFSLRQPVSWVMSTSCPCAWFQPRNLPGFRMPRGSRASFIFRWASWVVSLTASRHQRFLAMPTPCSPVMAPFQAMI